MSFGSGSDCSGVLLLALLRNTLGLWFDGFVDWRFIRNIGVRETEE